MNGDAAVRYRASVDSSRHEEGRVSAMTTWFEKYMDAAQDHGQHRPFGHSCRRSPTIPRLSAFADIGYGVGELTAAAAYFGGEYDEEWAIGGTQ